MNKEGNEKPQLSTYKKHIFVCTGSSCSAPETSMELYQGIKAKIKELNLDSEPDRILRSKSQCLGVCQGGPIVTVYPDGVWYDHVSPEKMDKIFKEHILGGKPVEEYTFYPDQR